MSALETFRTDWMPRGGDCIILRAEVLYVNGTGAILFALETRGEDGTTVTAITPTSPATGLELSTPGVGTCLYLATTSTTAGNGSQEQVRVVVTSSAEELNVYHVIRIFPLIFFDSARAY